MVTIRSMPPSARKRSAASRSSGRSPTTVMCATSTPSSPRRSETQGPLRSLVLPVRISVPVTTIPARTPAVPPFTGSPGRGSRSSRIPFESPSKLAGSVTSSFSLVVADDELDAARRRSSAGSASRSRSSPRAPTLQHLVVDQGRVAARHQADLHGGQRLQLRVLLLERVGCLLPCASSRAACCLALRLALRFTACLPARRLRPVAAVSRRAGRAGRAGRRSRPSTATISGPREGGRSPGRRRSLSSGSEGVGPPGAVLVAVAAPELDRRASRRRARAAGRRCGGSRARRPAPAAPPSPRSRARGCSGRGSWSAPRPRGHPSRSGGGRRAAWLRSRSDRSRLALIEAQYCGARPASSAGPDALASGGSARDGLPVGLLGRRSVAVARRPAGAPDRQIRGMSAWPISTWRGFEPS